MFYLLYADSNSPGFDSGGNAADNAKCDRLLSRRLICAMLQREHLSGLSTDKESGSLPCRIAFGEHGKPFLPDYPHLHFNISHSAGKAVCCVSDEEVGIDLQYKGFPTDTTSYSFAGRCLRIAERFFPPEDTDLLRSIPSAAGRIDLFFRLWTVREAYLKLTGEGMSAGLNSFHIVFSDSVLSDRYILRWNSPLQDPIHNPCRGIIIKGKDPVNCKDLPLHAQAHFAGLIIPGSAGFSAAKYCGTLCCHSPIPQRIRAEII